MSFESAILQNDRYTEHIGDSYVFAYSINLSAGKIGTVNINYEKDTDKIVNNINDIDIMKSFLDDMSDLQHPDILSKIIYDNINKLRKTLESKSPNIATKNTVMQIINEFKNIEKLLISYYNLDYDIDDNQKQIMKDIVNINTNTKINNLAKILYKRCGIIMLTIDKNNDIEIPIIFDGYKDKFSTIFPFTDIILVKTQ